MKTLPLKTKSINRSFLRHGYLLIPLVLACFALLPMAEAQLPSPTPDGGYPGNNTAEGDGALSSVQFNATTGLGSDNTAIGFQALFSNTTGLNNTANGVQALLHNTTGSQNTANGEFALDSNTTGDNNTAIGQVALGSNTTGFQNTGIGIGALFRNTTGFDNTAIGVGALESNTTSNDNTATGNFALNSNTTGPQNTANGFEALFSNTTGSNNTAVGVSALFNNTTGTQNTATGVGALKNNTVGDQNTANGFGALESNTNASNNTANGFDALVSNTAGNNTATGAFALNSNTTGPQNTAVGVSALLRNTTGKSNIALGFNAGGNLTTGNNNIEIGNLGRAGESNTIRIGTKGTHTNTFIAGISGVTVASGVGVIVGSNGQLGTVVSSAQFKEAIKPMDEASEAILALQPVTFRYKKELDPEGIPQFGLVAEQVEKVNPALVARDAEGKVYTVRYEAVNAMLLNEFLKEHRKVEEQQATIGELKSAVTEHEKLKTTIAQQQKQIETLTATVQKVSDQFALSKPAPQLVANP
jgi:trimeric autotransporter adhesin